MDAIGNEQIPVNHTAASEVPVQNTPSINTDDTASNDENNVDMAYVATSAIAMKLSVDDDSDDETRPNAKKMSAASSPASMQTDTYVSKEREEGDLPKISTFPPPLYQGNRGPMGDLCLLFALQVLLRGGSSRRGINTNHETPPPPPKHKEGHVKTASLRKS